MILTRVFFTRTFGSFKKKNRISNQKLCDAVAELDDGLYEANLGGSLYKKRIARDGKGKSGGFRSVIAFKSTDKAIFVYGFTKNERANIDKSELAAFKKLAKELLGLKPAGIQKALNARILEEVRCNNGE